MNSAIARWRIQISGLLLIALSGYFTSSVVYGDLPSAAEDTDTWLTTISARLQEEGIDLALNLNDSAFASNKFVRARLGKFPDLPAGLLPDSAELTAWEQEFGAQLIGAMALLPGPHTMPDDTLSYDGFVRDWFTRQDGQRVFVSFQIDDVSHAETIARIMRESGYKVRLFSSATDVDEPGRLYATAGLRMAIDSQQARGAGSQVTELTYLGQRLRNNSTSIFKVDPRLDRRLTRTEPSVFRKESLGDEYEASTIEEIIVPGGVALGEVAKLPGTYTDLVYNARRFWLVDETDRHWGLPHEDEHLLKSLFDFAQRSEAIHSDAIVDIDAEGRVKINSALRDTEAGYQFLKIDSEPFNFVRGIPVYKSVIIDKAVNYVASDQTQSLSFTTEYEIRFLAADSMRIAQSRVALEFDYDAAQEKSSHAYAWGIALDRLDENLDYTGLANATSLIGKYAGWIALFRRVERDPIRFLRGRYEFMKLEKDGRETPRRL